MVVLVGSAEDISITLRFARKYSLPITVCGGKHSSGGASSIDEEGVVIDLSKHMNKVTVDPEAKTVTSQGGAIWETVDKSCEKYGLATVGGTVNNTGVAGLTLGGGYGWLSGVHGVTVDNLLRAEMVLADGSIVQASADENADLFWAVRGAGACIGVASELTFRLHEQRPTVWAGILLYPEAAADAVVDFANHLSAVCKGECGIAVGVCCAPNTTEPSVLAVVFYNGSKEEGEAFFAPLLQLSPIINTTAEIPYSGLNEIVNGSTNSLPRKATKGSSVITPVRKGFFREIIANFHAFIQKVPDAAGSVVQLELINPGGWSHVPVTDMAFANRGHHCNVMVAPMWSGSENDTQCRSWARTMARFIGAEFERAKKEAGIPTDGDTVGEYLNFEGAPPYNTD